MWMRQLIEQAAQRSPDRLALIDGERRVTFRELERRTAALAAGLGEYGVSRGSRVAVLSHNRAEVIETYLALGQAGAAFVPLNGSGPAAGLLELVETAKVDAVIGSAAEIDRADIRSSGRPVIAFEDPWYEQAASAQPPAHRPVTDAGDILTVLHTSATTGRPKGVMTDHRSLRALTLGFLSETPIEDDTVLLNCNPLFHGSMVKPLMYLAGGATIALVPSFTPQGCLAAIERTRATHLWLVPEMLRFLLRARALPSTDLSSLREILYAAAPMPAEVIKEAHERLGCRFRQIYGVTEAGGPVAQLRPEDHDFSAEGLRAPERPVGRALPGVSVAVHDESGRPLPAGQVGEILVGGDGLMRGYLDDAHATDEAMADGWVRTGDLGSVDEAGFIRLSGRIKDLINRGGQKVYPAEVEQVLARHATIAEVAVVAAPDPDWGEVPVAFAVPAPGTEPDEGELLRYCVPRLDEYKRPVAVRFTAALPKNPAGKLLRRELQELLAADRSSGTRR